MGVDGAVPGTCVSWIFPQDIETENGLHAGSPPSVIRLQAKTEAAM